MESVLTNLGQASNPQSQIQLDLAFPMMWQTIDCQTLYGLWNGSKRSMKIVQLRYPPPDLPLFK